jgi:surfactin synthase thioesterase subunit
MPWCHELPDAEFVERLVSYGGIPEEIREAPDVIQLFLPVLRADMRIAERYLRSPGPPIDRPVSVLYGTDDPLVSPAGVSAWRGETVAPVEITALPGGHFCFQEPGYLSRLRDTLAALPAPSEGSSTRLSKARPSGA